MSVEPKDCLKELEWKVVDLALTKLFAMQTDYQACHYFGGCSLLHLAEMVKLCHQIRSLQE